MKQPYKFRSIYFLYGVLTAVIIYSQTWKTAAASIRAHDFFNSLTNFTDTTKPIVGKDSIAKPADIQSDTTRPGLMDTLPGKEKVDTFSFKISKDSLDAPLKYEAEDSAVIMVVDKKIFLYGKTKTDYKDISLTAPQVELDQQTQIVTAVNSKDSTGSVIETAHFKSGEDEFTSDTIRFNIKTQIGQTKNTYSQQGEFLVIGEVAKKVNPNTTFIKGARFTTCLLDDPHFDIKTNKMKVINEKLAVSGPAHLEFEGVPIPIYLPFGIYPLSQKRHSGLLRPSFTTDEARGIGLQNFGYYKVLSDYWDAQLTGELYSYGEWAASLRTTYRKRYKYSGGFNLSFRASKLNFKGDPDFSKTRLFSVTWNHSMDSKARPGVTFAASVNASSTKYNRSLPGNALGNYGGRTPLNYQNMQGSSISYSKTWKDKPFNLTLSATHSQNNNLGLITINLPNAAFTVSTVYPFQKKNRAGTPKWYEQLGIAYNGSFSNTISFNDTLTYGKNGVKPFFKYLLDTAQWMSQHNIPITLSLPPILGGKIMVSPGMNYGQTWIQRVTNYSWNAALKKVDTFTTKGFFIDQRGGISLNFNTALFGTYQFKKSRVMAIRHVIRPTAGFSYTPDLNIGHIKRIQVDTTGRMLSYNEIGGAFLYNATSRKSASINFGIDNNIEMKYRSKKDTGAAAIKKVKIIEGFGFNGSYNLMLDSMNLSPINIYFRTTLFEKININASTILNPYQSDASGYDIGKYAWQGKGFKLGRLTTGSISASTNFQSKPKDAKKEAERKKLAEERLNDPVLIGDQQRLLEYMQQNPAEFVDFNISWQLSLGYSLSFSSVPKPDFSGFKKEFYSGLTFNGSFNLTPKWKLSTSGSFDFNTMDIQYLTMSINRDLHCWQLSINVVPVGFSRSFNFSISPKAGVLQDLKINRSRVFY